MTTTVPKPATTQTFHPQVFGKFFLLQKLAAGGMAEIFRAKAYGAGGFEKDLVVKRILPALSQDKQFVRMLVNEAKLTVSLTHPTIAQVYELGEVENTYFISMEYVEGASLHDLMYTAKQAGRPLTIEQSIYICLETLRALDFAHKKTDGQGQPLGIVHCDISPDNVMVTWDGGAKLMDFGVARAAQSSLSNYREGTLMGKLNYVAPEQADGEWFDHRVDLFAVGVMFYELITGTHPFGRISNLDALRDSRKKPVTPPSEMKPGVPKLLDEFVVKSLARAREDRYQSAKEMADQLVDFLFPTPTLAVAEHLAVTMKELYKERIERQQRLRHNDALNIKVLMNSKAKELEQAAAASQKPVLHAGSFGSAGEPADVDIDISGPEPGGGTKVFVSALDPKGVSALDGSEEGGKEKGKASTRFSSSTGAFTGNLQRTIRRARRNLILGAVLGAIIGAAGAVGWLGKNVLPVGPTLVVVSDPLGAEVELAGTSLGKTPVILEDAPLGDGPAELKVVLADHRDEVRSVSRDDRRTVVITVTMQNALGSIRIESDPPGAKIRFDGKDLGVTPVTVSDIRVDEGHRVDLEKKGFDLDSFVVKPFDSGPVVKRTLVKLDK